MTGQEFLHLLFQASKSYPALVVLCLWLTLAPSSFGQTAIVALKLKDQIVVGADSKRVRGDQKVAVQEPVCKIFRGDGFFFASAGFAYDAKTGFSAESVIAKAPKMVGSIEQKVEKLEALIKAPLTEILERYRQGFPTSYATRFRTASALQMVFFGVERGSLIIVVRDFAPTPSLSQPVKLEITRYKCPGDCPNGEQIFKLGRYEAIDRFLRNQPDYWKRSPIQAARKFIELEIADVPDVVGPPIDIIQVTSKGPRWIARKQQCVVTNTPPGRRK